VKSLYVQVLFVMLDSVIVLPAHGRDAVAGLAADADRGACWCRRWR
jgi:hypothetical protein